MRNYRAEAEVDWRRHNWLAKHPNTTNKEEWPYFKDRVDFVWYCREYKQEAVDREMKAKLIALKVDGEVF